MRTVTVAVCFLLLLPQQSSAWDFKIKDKEFTLDLTNTFGYTYHLDNDEDPQIDIDDKYHQILNVLDASLSYGDFRVGGRLDLHIFADTPFDQRCKGSFEDPSFCDRQNFYFSNSIVPERLYFIWARPEFDLTLGDFYVSLGKGIALNVVKIDALGQDTAIRGGKFVLHNGNWGFTFVGGQFNPLNLDESRGVHGEVQDPELSLQMVPAIWPEEPVLGGRLEYRLLDSVLLGIHGVWIISDDPNSRGTTKAITDYNAVWGTGFETSDLFDGVLSIAGEIDFQRTVSLGRVVRGPGFEKNSLGEEISGLPGMALYSSATLTLGELTFLGEFKYYNDFLLKGPNHPDEPYALLYSQPPTLERINTEILNNSSVGGGRLRLDYNFGEVGPFEILVFASYAYFQTWPSVVGTERHGIHDPFYGLELQWQQAKGHCNLSNGVRYEMDRDNKELYRREIHVELEIEEPLWSSHSLKIYGLYQYRNKQGTFGDLNKWHEMDSFVEYKWSPWISGALTVELAGDPYVVGDKHRPYFAGALRYFFDSSNYLSLRVGENRPGLKCLNGVCRLYPGFAGAQLMFVGRM